MDYYVGQSKKEALEKLREDTIDMYKDYRNSNSPDINLFNIIVFSLFLLNFTFLKN